MYKKLIFLSSALFMLFIISCSETIDPIDGASVKVITKMEDNTVSTSGIIIKNVQTQSGSIDSIAITSFRMLLSRLKFQAMKGDNDPNGNEHEMKAGPFLLRLDSTGKSFTIASSVIPEGTYSRIKFEMHRFDSSELSEWASDPVYSDFATPDRYTAIIEGVIYENDGSEAFKFSVDPVANLWIDFDPEIQFEEGKSYTISIEIDPSAAFVSEGNILDPRNPKDSNHIRNAIRDAFKSVKRD